MTSGGRAGRRAPGWLRKRRGRALRAAARRGLSRVTAALSGPVLVEQATGPSAACGDLLSNDYQRVIPDVRSAAYTGTLTYIATATP